MVTMVTMRMPTLTNRPRLASARTEASCCGDSGARDASAGRPAQMDCRDGPGGAARLRDRDAREAETCLERRTWRVWSETRRTSKGCAFACAGCGWVGGRVTSCRGGRAGGTHDCVGLGGVDVWTVVAETPRAPGPRGRVPRAPRARVCVARVTTNVYKPVSSTHAKPRTTVVFPRLKATSPRRPGSRAP